MNARALWLALALAFDAVTDVTDRRHLLVFVTSVTSHFWDDVTRKLFRLKDVTRVTLVTSAKVNSGAKRERLASRVAVVLLWICLDPFYLQIDRHIVGCYEDFNQAEKRITQSV